MMAIIRNLYLTEGLPIYTCNVLAIYMCYITISYNIQVLPSLQKVMVHAALMLLFDIEVYFNLL